jgi:hypothetical protein
LRALLIQEGVYLNNMNCLMGSDPELFRSIVRRVAQGLYETGYSSDPLENWVYAERLFVDWVDEFFPSFKYPEPMGAIRNNISVGAYFRRSGRQKADWNVEVSGYAALILDRETSKNRHELTFRDLTRALAKCFYDKGYHDSPDDDWLSAENAIKDFIRRKIGQCSRADALPWLHKRIETEAERISESCGCERQKSYAVVLNSLAEEIELGLRTVPDGIGQRARVTPRSPAP